MSTPSPCRASRWSSWSPSAGSICASRRGGIPALADEEKIRACMEEYPLLETGFRLN